VIIGDGPERDRLETEACDRGLPIHYFGHIDKKEIPDVLSLADLCYVGFKFNPLYKYGMSANKLWDYMMASKPIVMSIDSCNDPVAEANCGITINSGDSGELAAAFSKILSLPESSRNLLGENGKRYVVANNSYDVLAKKMLDIFRCALDKK
jgi:glycosyltransferase involved in cell wall biosynthesis